MQFYLVLEPAAIVEKPESIKVTTGDTCTLECVVTGTPELSTKWFKDGKELTSDSKYKISFFNKVSGLKIINVAPRDSGVYSFEVQNPVGKDSCTVSVQVSGWLVRLLLQCYYNVVPDLHIYVGEDPSSTALHGLTSSESVKSEVTYLELEDQVQKLYPFLIEKFHNSEL